MSFIEILLLRIACLHLAPTQYATSIQSFRFLWT